MKERRATSLTINFLIVDLISSSIFYLNLSNSQYDAVMRVYNEKRLKCHAEEIKRYEEITHLIPELEEIDNKIASLSSKRTILLINGNDKAADELKNEINTLRKQKPLLLVKNGFPKDYLDSIYICKDCHDTGYINNKRCHCFDKTLITLFYAQTSLSDILEEENFKNFNINYYSKTEIDSDSGKTPYDLAKNALNQSFDFIENMGKPNNNLLILGNVGVGKTFLSHCIARELINRDYTVLYFTAFEFFDLSGKALIEHDKKSRALYNKCFSCDLLIIDDLGAEVANRFTLSQFFNCVNERLIANASTIISTNLSIKGLHDLYSERTVSRLTSSYSVIRMAGSDIRIHKFFSNNKED